MLRARLLAALLLLPGAVQAGGPADEAAVAARVDALRASPVELHALLRRMPKGADLHNHLSGAVYAESLLRWAAADGLCLQRDTVRRPPCDARTGRPPLAAALAADPALGPRLVDAWSMRNSAHAGASGHDQFFATFGRFSEATAARAPDMLAEVLARAGAEGLQHLELMVSPDGGAARAIGRHLGWDPDPATQEARLLAYRPAAPDDPPALDTALAQASERLDAMEAGARERLGCAGTRPDPGCAVGVRYLVQVGRAAPPEQVHAQMLAGFELARRDPRVAGLNLVQPEDDAAALRDFDLHMALLAALRAHYPEAHLSLHAGELAAGLVPPEALRRHIADSVRVAGAERIGHGVDVFLEDDPDALLDEMAARGVLVEVCLSSNDLILGVRGADHPLHGYLRHGVAVALATDDAGVARSTVTGEWVRAVLDQGLDYRTLKALARASLEHAFLDGASLWEDARAARAVLVCREATAEPGPACAAFLAGSPRAAAQWALEQALRGFEAAVATSAGSR